MNNNRAQTRMGSILTKKELLAALWSAALFILSATPAFGKGPKAYEAADTITASSAFARLPLTVLDILRPSTRLDMLDYWNADSVWHAPNTLGGESLLERVGPDYLTVRLTEVSTLQICVLPRWKSHRLPLVMTLYTIGGKNEGGDTEISFFDSDLNPVSADKFFKAPETKDFFRAAKGSKVKVRELEAQLPFATVSYIGIPGNPFRMMGRLTAGAWLAEEAREALTPYLLKGIEWEWDGQKFVKKKTGE